MSEVSLPVTGMSCGGCENAVKRAVGALRARRRGRPLPSPS